jgi:hypothetical protein
MGLSQMFANSPIMGFLMLYIMDYASLYTDITR